MSVGHADWGRWAWDGRHGSFRYAPIRVISGRKGGAEKRT